MERRVRDEHRVGVCIDASDHVIERSAETNVRGVIGRECCARHGERIDEIYLVTGSAKNRCGLHGADVCEVRVVDEVARDANRREDDRDAGHGA